MRVCGRFKTPLRPRDNSIGVGALLRHRRRRGLGAIVWNGIARETVEGRGAVSGSLAGMFPARRRASKLVGKQIQLSWRAPRPSTVSLLDFIVVHLNRPKSPASTAWTFSLAISGGPPPRKV